MYCAISNVKTALVDESFHVRHEATLKATAHLADVSFNMVNLCDVRTLEP